MYQVALILFSVGFLGAAVTVAVVLVGIVDYRGEVSQMACHLSVTILTAAEFLRASTDGGWWFGVFGFLLGALLMNMVYHFIIRSDRRKRAKNEAAEVKAGQTG